MSIPTERYENEPTSRTRAYDVAIAFGRKTGMLCQPRPSGCGLNVIIPVEFLDETLVSAGLIEPRPPSPEPRPTAVYKDKI